MFPVKLLKPIFQLKALLGAVILPGRFSFSKNYCNRPLKAITLLLTH